MNAKKLTTMTNNIKWVVLLTLALGYAAAAAMAGADTNNTEKTTGRPKLSLIEEDSLLHSRWKTASIQTTLPTTFRDTLPNVLKRSEALSAVFDSLCKSKRALRVYLLGDSHTADGNFPQALKSTLEAAWGKAANDSIGDGVSFRYEGINGARIIRFATPEFMAKMAAQQPDLLIVAFGTNECHSLKYSEAVHRQQIEKFYQMLKQTCPGTAMLITTPPGACLNQRAQKNVKTGKRNKTRRVSYYTKSNNPMTIRCATLLEDFGATNKLPVWDLYTIVGGTHAVNNWLSAEMLRNDRVHFTPEGYQLQGKMLGEAILTAYNQYLDAH